MKPLKKKKEKSNSRVRYSGVCQCETYEHCSKCDPEYFNEEKRLRCFRSEIIEEMRRREREGPINGLDGMFLCLAEEREIYPDDIIEKYGKRSIPNGK
jgi:hypothetical protein